MIINRHLEQYAGLPVTRFSDETALGGRSAAQDADRRHAKGLPPPAEAAWYVAASHMRYIEEERFGEEWFGEVFARFLNTVDTAEVTALIIGFWGFPGVTRPVPALVEAAAAVPKLRSLFLGDITHEELEIPYIPHQDISPLFAAFPGLERLDVRGQRGLSLSPIVSENLRVLRFESGGLPRGVVQAVGASDLPNLEHLDLWLGEIGEEDPVGIADLAPFLSGERFPALRHLGLEDSELQDEIAAAVAGAPVVARLESLSLAMGTLTDQGAEILLSGQPLTHLRRLDLHHHYFLSDTMMRRVSAALPGVEVDLGNQEEPDGEWHHVGF